MVLRVECSCFLIARQGIPGCVPWGVSITFLNDYLATDKGLGVFPSTCVLTLYGVGGIIGVQDGVWLNSGQQGLLHVPCVVLPSLLVMVDRHTRLYPSLDQPSHRRCGGWASRAGVIQRPPTQLGNFHVRDDHRGRTPSAGDNQCQLRQRPLARNGRCDVGRYVVVVICALLRAVAIGIRRSFFVSTSTWAYNEFCRRHGT